MRSKKRTKKKMPFININDLYTQLKYVRFFLALSPFFSIGSCLLLGCDATGFEETKCLSKFTNFAHEHFKKIMSTL